MAKELRAPGRMMGTSIPAFPTPVIGDTIEVELVDVNAGHYSPRPYGTRWNDVDHGAFVKDLPFHVLVFEEPADGSGGTRRRTWASARADQDTYNFAISFEGNNPEFPTYTRVYVLPREGYSPLPLLDPDPFDPFAFLVSEQLLAEVEPKELKSVFVKVARIYSTLPGPVTYAIDYPYGGHPSYPRITTKQKFSHMKFPESLGTRCPIENYGGAILVGQTIQQVPEQFGVDLLQRIFDVVPLVVYKGDTLEDGTIAEEDNYGGQEGFGYNVGYMYGKREFPFLTWKFTLPLDGYQPTFDLSPCPIEGYEALRLVTQETLGDEKQAELITVSRRYETLPGPLIHKVDYENNNHLFPIVSTSQRVAETEYVPGTRNDYCEVPGHENLALVEQHLAPTDYGVVKEDQRIFELNPSDQIVSLDYDSTINAFIRTIKQKVPTGTIPAFDDLTLEFREKPVDKYRTVQIYSKLTALPATRIEYKTVNNWAFPTLLTGIKLLKSGLIANRGEVVWFPNTLRPIQNVPAILRITTSYHLAPPPPETIFVLPTRNIVYQGISYQLSISNVLCDAISVTVTFVNDTKYGNLSETATFAKTNPSATEYYAQIGKYKVVGCDITQWRARIFTKTVTEVVLV